MGSTKTKLKILIFFGFFFFLAMISIFAKIYNLEHLFSTQAQTNDNNLVLGSINGKKITKNDLNREEKQLLFDAQMNLFREVERLLEKKALDAHLTKNEIKILLLKKPDYLKNDIDVSHSFFMGTDNPKINLVEYVDIQSPFSVYSKQLVDELMALYPNKIKYYFKNFPVEQLHGESINSAIAAICAGEQGKFWQIYEELLKSQEQLGKTLYFNLASTLGLDLNNFNTCFYDPRIRSIIQNDIEEGKKLGVGPTPSFFINGVFISGKQPKSDFETLINDLLSE